MKAFLLTLFTAVALWAQTPVHGIYEHTLRSAKNYEDPLRDVQVTVHLMGPGGQQGEALAFWDGGDVWRFRFSPTAPGEWRFHTRASDTANHGLHDVHATMQASEALQATELARRGAPQVSKDGHYFTYADGAPFFWLGCTAWNGALLSTDAEWKRYLRDRVEKKFTVIQLVMTQWRAGREDENGRTAFRGQSKITIDPEFFQRMDKKIREVVEHGLVPAPVVLWALTSKDNESPGEVLPVDQATLLANYIVARYEAYPLFWLLGGDGEYAGENTKRWSAIGRKVFPAARFGRPVTLHPRGMRSPWKSFGEEDTWIDFYMYQSGHGDNANKWKWNATEGMAKDWQMKPPKPVIDGEINYEGHSSYQSKDEVQPYAVRHAAYYSLLAAPPAGVTYGAHGIWPWHRKAKVPLAHERAGIAKPWHTYLEAPGAKQMKILHEVFASIDWWKLRPDRSLLREDTYKEDFSDYVMPARAEDGGFALVYLPAARPVTLDLSKLHGQVSATWIDPRNGKRIPAEKRNAIAEAQYEPPSGEDWLLLLESTN